VRLEDIQMALLDFVSRYNLRLKRDACGDPIVIGKRFGTRKEDCCHVFEGFSSGLGVCFLFHGAKKWGFVRRAMEAAGCILRQGGHTEGTFFFDPTDAIQCQTVIRLAGLKRVRKPSPAQLEALEVARASQKAA
jgi:hypothetical protein